MYLKRMRDYVESPVDSCYPDLMLMISNDKLAVIADDYGSLDNLCENFGMKKVSALTDFSFFRIAPEDYEEFYRSFDVDYWNDVVNGRV